MPNVQMSDEEYQRYLELLPESSDAAFSAELDAVPDWDKEGIRRVLAKHGRLQIDEPEQEEKGRLTAEQERQMHQELEDAPNREAEKEVLRSYGRLAEGA